MPRKYSETQIKEFISNFESDGPYTAAEVVRLSHILKKQHKGALKQPLSNCLHKFSAKELNILFKLDKHEKTFDAVEDATGYFMVGPASIGRMNDEQLKIVGKHWTRNDHCSETLEDSCLRDSDYKDIHVDLVRLIHRAEKRKLEEKEHSTKRVKQ